ncbi:MAG: hypothetical protein AAF330_05120 [Pseudomonadota bacterium]
MTATLNLRALAWALLLTSVAMGTPAQPAEFGDNTSSYANDGECDDRRFVGRGMALDVDDNYHDADDCRHLFQYGALWLWNETQAQAATQCTAIEFGDDSGDYTHDGECDDARFDGPGTASTITTSSMYRDASDCRAQCNAGRAMLRHY